jgi:hypothetical protein
LVAYAEQKGGQWRIVTMAAEFAALVGSRQIEFLKLGWPQFGTDEVRLRRAKQRKGVEKVERITVSRPCWSYEEGFRPSQRMARWAPYSRTARATRTRHPGSPRCGAS